MRSDRSREDFYAIPSPSSQSSDLEQQQSSQQQLYTVQRAISTGTQQQQQTIASYAPNSSLSNVAQQISRGAGSEVDCGIVQNSPGEWMVLVNFGWVAKSAPNRFNQEWCTNSSTSVQNTERCKKGNSKRGKVLGKFWRNLEKSNLEIPQAKSIFRTSEQ